MMMMWGGGWWVFGAVIMVVCIFLMGRMMMGRDGSGHGDHSGSHPAGSTRSAEEILAERFARGEISQEEFAQRKKVLKGLSD
jgi:putative membrane protein